MLAGLICIGWDLRNNKVWRWEYLTVKEKRVAFAMVVEGMKYEAMAQKFGVSRSTIKQTVGAIYRVLGVADSVELAFEMGKIWSTISEEQNGRSKGINKQNPV
jgi:DNA-binding CsgD family transcriptional regulator